MAEVEPLELLKWGMWVFKIPNIPRGSEPPKVFDHWGRYFMWINKGTIYYGEAEGKPSFDVPVASCRAAARFDPEEFSAKKGRGAPSILTDFAWILKTVEFTTIFVSDSESQCQCWVDGINSMLPLHLQPQPAPNSNYGLNNTTSLVSSSSTFSPARRESIQTVNGYVAAPHTASRAPSTAFRPANDPAAATPAAGTVAGLYPPTPSDGLAPPPHHSSSRNAFDDEQLPYPSLAASQQLTYQQKKHQQEIFSSRTMVDSVYPPHHQQPGTMHHRTASSFGAATLVSGGYPSGGNFVHEEDLFLDDAQSVIAKNGGVTSPSPQHLNDSRHLRGGGAAAAAMERPTASYHQYNQYEDDSRRPPSIVTSPMSPEARRGGSSSLYNNGPYAPSAVENPTSSRTYASFDEPNNTNKNAPHLRGSSSDYRQGFASAHYNAAAEERSRGAAVYGAGGGALVVPEQQAAAGAASDFVGGPYYTQGYNSQQKFSGGDVHFASPTAADTSNMQLVSQHDLAREEEAKRRFKAAEEQRLAEEAMDVVAMGTWVQKVKGDDANSERNKTFSSKVEWHTRWMWMEGLRSSSNGHGVSAIGVGSMGSGMGGGASAGTVLFYGPEKGKKEKQIQIDKCVSVERLSDEEMYSFKAPSHLYGFGLRLRAPGGKNWVFACESEVEALGWFKVWKKIMPLSTMELAREVQKSYEETMHQQDYLNEKHKAAEAARKRAKAEEEERQRLIEERAAELAAKRAAEEEKKLKEREKAMEAERAQAVAAQLSVQQQFQLAILHKQKAEQERLALQASQQETLRAFQQEMQRQIEAKAREEKLLAKMREDHEKALEEQRARDAAEAERKINEQVEKKLLEVRLKQYEEEEAARKKAAEEAAREEEERKRREAERLRLQQELEEDERRMAEAHAEAMARKKKKDTGCCVVS